MSNQINFVSGMLKNAENAYQGSRLQKYLAEPRVPVDLNPATNPFIGAPIAAPGPFIDQSPRNESSGAAQLGNYLYDATRGTAFDGSRADLALNNPAGPTAPPAASSQPYGTDAMGQPNPDTAKRFGQAITPQYREGAVGMPNGPTATPQNREGAVGMPNGPTATPAAPPSLSITTGVEQGSPTMGFNSNPAPAAPTASSQPYGTDAMGQTNPDTAKRFGQAIAPAAPTAPANPYTDPRENRANTTIPRPAAATPPAAARPPAGRYPNASSAAPSGQNDLFKKYHGTSYDPNSTEDRSKMQALQASKGNPAKMLQTANAFPLHKRASAYPGF